MSFGTKLSNGWLITKTSLHFALANKKTVIFALLPLPLFIATLGFFAIFTLAICFITGAAGNTDTASHINALPFTGILSVCGALCLFTLATISVFFRSALSNYITHTIRHEPASIGSSLKAILPRLGTIIKYAALATALNIILSIILRNKRRGNLALRITSSLLHSTLQLGWNILTFFMIPILGLETTNTIDSLKLSGQTFKKTWGESLSGSFSLSGITFLFSIAYGLCLWMLYGLLHFIVGPFIAGLLLCLAVLFFIVINNTISVIFQTTLYLYATEGLTGPFDKKFLANSFEVQKNMEPENLV